VAKMADFIVNVYVCVVIFCVIYLISFIDPNKLYV